MTTAEKTIGAGALAGRIGEEIGVSDWIEVNQSQIALFADATLDHQFIHVDPERARQMPFGGTIAHGFLTLSLLSRMAYEALPRIENSEVSLNYGFDRVRFPAPVKSGQRVRACFLLRDVRARSRDELLLTYSVTVEIEGGQKPALVAEWLTLAVLRPDA